MKNRLFIAAYKGEVQPLINQLELKPDTADRNYWTNSTGDALQILGPDPLTTLFRLASRIREGGDGLIRVINLGFCGGLRGGLRVGEVYRIGYVHQMHMGGQSRYIPSKKSFLSPQDTGGLSCVTVERKIEQQDKNQMAAWGDVCDQELYWIVRFCLALKLDWKSLKIVSDLCDETCEAIISQKDELSAKLVKVFFEQEKDREIIRRSENQPTEINAFVGDTYAFSVNQKRIIAKLLDYLMRAQDHGSDLNKYFTEFLETEFPQSIGREKFDKMNAKQRAKHMVDFLRKKTGVDSHFH